MAIGMWHCHWLRHHPCCPPCGSCCKQYHYSSYTYIYRVMCWLSNSVCAARTPEKLSLLSLLLLNGHHTWPLTACLHARRQCTAVTYDFHYRAREEGQMLSHQDFDHSLDLHTP